MKSLVCIMLTLKCFIDIHMSYLACSWRCKSVTQEEHEKKNTPLTIDNQAIAGTMELVLSPKATN